MWNKIWNIIKWILTIAKTIENYKCKTCKKVKAYQDMGPLQANCTKCIQKIIAEMNKNSKE